MAFAKTNTFVNGNVADADEVNANFDEIVDEFNLTTATGKLALGIPPVGSILPWAKTLTGVPALPSGYVECDGSVLSDGDSLLNGQTIPDLNGDNQFMRGNSTSGATGGTDTINQSTGEAVLSGSEASQLGTGTLKHTHNVSHDNRPAFYDVVWIMRVK